MEKKEKLELRENSSSCKLVIPSEVEEKIRHLCSIIHDVEWSGVLFYRPEGNLDDGTFKATCVDIFVMDIGNATFTSYTESPDVISYQVAHKELLSPDIQEALVHSHNNMSAFFSGTDAATLLQEGTERNHFLSLIVNNAGNYVARITRKVTMEAQVSSNIKYVESSSYNTYDNKEVILKDKERRSEQKTVNKTEQWVEYFNLTIEKHEASDKFDELNTRLRELRTPKRTIKPKVEDKKEEAWWKQPFHTKERTPSFSDYKGYYDYSAYKYNPKSESPWDWEPSTVRSSKSTKDDRELAHNILMQFVTGSVLINTEKLELEKWVSQMDTVYKKRFNDNYEDMETWFSNFLDSLLIFEFELSEATMKRVADEMGVTTQDIDETVALIFLMEDELGSVNAKSKVKDFMLTFLETYIY